ncbi:CLUMA_CG002735, isoform A [Clunio marinus]|uniref:CLUMA_CG002735, isoform A n=1 Tax=Clunio marinus TaxID=568069 RepID=A0A1J1HLR2_9DIPT|nr:CLUMA_CG002735, isoform A [Clunio marinus]
MIKTANQSYEKSTKEIETFNGEEDKSLKISVMSQKIPAINAINQTPKLNSTTHCHLFPASTSHSRYTKMQQINSMSVGEL